MPLTIRKANMPAATSPRVIVLRSVARTTGPGTDRPVGFLPRFVPAQTPAVGSTETASVGDLTGTVRTAETLIALNSER